ncbi:Aquaporin-like protein, partial [Cynara cardunculus var. scolymus]
MSPRRYAIGTANEATHRDFACTTLSEYLSASVFVFVVEGSVLALKKAYGGDVLGAMTNVLVVIATTLALFVLVSSNLNISSGHIKPAITFGTLVTGRVSLVRELYHWVAQLIIFLFPRVSLLRPTTVGM